MDKLNWGNSKRQRCKLKVKDSDKNGGLIRSTKITSRVDRKVVERDSNSQYHPPSTSLRDLGINRSCQMENRKIVSTSSSPEKEDRYYTTRGSVGLADESAKLFIEAKEDKNNKQKVVWPKLYISLSNKEKEEDFMAMKGCKLPQRPKKRAKLVQRTLLLVSPGAWLSDLCQERYEVREKKASKKRPRGLKAMGGMESDSE